MQRGTLVKSFMLLAGNIACESRTSTSSVESFALRMLMETVVSPTCAFLMASFTRLSRPCAFKEWPVRTGTSRETPKSACRREEVCLLITVEDSPVTNGTGRCFEAKESIGRDDSLSTGRGVKPGSHDVRRPSSLPYPPHATTIS